MRRGCHRFAGVQRIAPRIAQERARLALGARVCPDMFSLAQANKACDGEGRISDPRLQERFDANLVNFMDLVEASKHYPCVKRQWVEYLGEHPEPSLDRVE